MWQIATQPCLSVRSRFQVWLRLVFSAFSALMAEGTIRAQAKLAKEAAKAGKDSHVPADGRERMDKEIVKAVLASPLIVPWCVVTPPGCNKS